VLRLAALVLPLCLDTFAVSVLLGAAGLSRRQRLQVSLLFPAAEIAMPVLGLLLGDGIARAIGGAADYLAAAALIAVGALLLAEDDRVQPERVSRRAGAGGWALISLSVGVALDELALGFGIGLLRISLVAACIMIGVQAVIASQLGLLLGDRVGRRLREGAGRLAGLVLAGIGILVFFERLSG
jgi:manganese efflux pump family protein